MALGASKPSQKEEFLCHRTWSRRLQRSFYFSRKSLDDCCSLPLTLLAARVFSERPGGRLRCLPVREAAAVSHQACLSPAALVMAMVYLERLAANNADYLRNADPKHLFVASTLAASKYLYDSGEEERTFNDEWAASAQLDVQQLNHAERHFLAAMDWELYVSGEEFEAMSRRLEAAAALAESRRRGWLTYADAAAAGTHALIADTVSLLTDALIKVVAVCSVAYVASVITLFSSVCLVFDAPAAPAPPAVFLARAPATADAGSVGSSGSLLGQLTVGLSMLAAVAPLAAVQTDERNVMEEGSEEEDGGDEEDEAAQRNETWPGAMVGGLPARLRTMEIEVNLRRVRLPPHLTPGLTSDSATERNGPEPPDRLLTQPTDQRRHPADGAAPPLSSSFLSAPHPAIPTHRIQPPDFVTGVSPPLHPAPHSYSHLRASRRTYDDSIASPVYATSGFAFAPPSRLSLDVFKLKIAELRSRNASLSCGWERPGGMDLSMWGRNVALCR